MTSRQLDEETIFHTARKTADAEGRQEYLDQICAGDLALRQRVEALLATHEQESEFLKSNPPLAPTLDQPSFPEAAGQQIGRYKLLQQIGEGGFGVVYMAEQARPIRRKVALKLIKPGMDSKAVVTRFEAERQALAMMDHENIARVLDGGATDSGRPYFVMELVKGVPITEYCDQNNLPTDDRLKLFITVCQAVQHAHQKGIIHRDIKPSNVLVTLHDGKPVVKVIDFGVAKAINQQLTEKTLFTTYGQMIGTPQYMSPEQAEMSGLDVDTRSDIYSLGVLLYELLTGTTPLESERLRTAGYAEMQRLIREEEPPKPSTRLSTSGEKLTVIAKHRGIAPDRLQKIIRGDLDWIVMKALEKDRARRYETSAGFSLDVERFLHTEPVTARPPSMRYRLLRFTQKHWSYLATATIILACLLGGTIVSTVLALQKRATLKQFAESQYSEAVVGALMADETAASLARDAAQQAGISSAKLRIVDAITEIAKGNYENATNLADSILTDRFSDEASRVDAQALLVQSTALAFNWERSGLEYSKFVRLDQKRWTDSNHLLAAFAQEFMSPQRALSNLSQSGKLQRSLVGMRIKAVAELHLALDSRDVQLIEQVAMNLMHISQHFPDPQEPEMWLAEAFGFAIQWARLDGRGYDLHRYEHQANPLANKMAKDEFQNFGSWHLLRALQMDEAADELFRLKPLAEGYSCYLAAECLENESPETAASCFDQVISKSKASSIERIMRGFLICNRQDADEIKNELKPLAKSRSGFVARWALSGLCLAYSPEEIRQLAKKVLVENAIDETDSIVNASSAIQFFADGNEAAFLQRSKGHAFQCSFAHFHIGMLRLAEGKKHEAEAQFTKCLETDLVGTFDYEMARACLERMKKYPTWPEWILNHSDN